MDTLTIPEGFVPRPYQLPLLQYMDSKLADPNTTEAKALLVWPRQVGKDTTCFAFMVNRASKVSGNYFYIFPTSKEARKALWDKILDDGTRLIDVIPAKCIKRIANQDMFIELNYDVLGVRSTIQVIGLDLNPDAIRGITPQGVVLSEFAFSDFSVYKNLLSALRRKGCWHIINSTPNGRNHFYNMYQGATKSDGWFVSYLQGLYPDKDNFVYINTPEFFEEQIKVGQTTREDLEREIGCSFATGMQGAFYIDQIEQAYNSNRIGEFSYDPTMKVDTFWDLGVDDSTAVWFRQRVNNKIIFIDYFEDSGKDLSYYVQMLENKGYNYGTHYLPHDANHRSLQTGNTTARMFEDLLRDARIGSDVWVLEKLPVQDGINAVRTRFGRYHFDVEKCGEALKKLELYHRRYDKKRETFISEPVHDQTSHTADALRSEAMSEDVRQDLFYKINNIKAISEYNPFDD